MNNATFMNDEKMDDDSRNQKRDVAKYPILLYG
jgi:hypothetical protein